MFSTQAFGAVAHVADSGATIEGDVDNILNATLTVSGGTNNAIAACVSWVGNGTTVSSVVWDAAGANQAMTAVGAETGQGNYRVRPYVLANPTAGSSKLVTATLSAAVSEGAVVASHFQGVNSTPIRAGTYNTNASAGGPPLSVVITSQTDDMTFSCFVSDGFQANPSTDKTLVGAAFNNYGLGMDYAAGAATVTHTWSEGGSVAAVAVGGASLAASTGGGGGGNNRKFRRVN